MPTLAEAGVSGADIQTWYAMYVTAGSPKAAVDRLVAELNAALKTLELAANTRRAWVNAVAAREARFAVSGVNLGLFCSTPSVALRVSCSPRIAAVYSATLFVAVPMAAAASWRTSPGAAA